MIGPRSTEASREQFKSDVMARCRSVEEEYWSLAQARVQLWASEQAVTIARDILDRETSEDANGRGTHADVAEAAQRLESFNLDSATRRADVIAAEQRLRKLLDLPAIDDRRIVPASSLCDDRTSLDRAAAISKPPGAANEVNDFRKTSQQGASEKTNSLRRSFLEAESSQKHLKTAMRLHEAAAQRLDAQRAYYEEGRITVDRLLDAVSQYATSVATEAQYGTLHRIALTKLSEAKGTLLADREIVVVEGDKRLRTARAKGDRDQRIAPAALAVPFGTDAVGARTPPPGGYAVPVPGHAAGTSPASGPALPEPSRQSSKKTRTDPAPRAWNFSFSIGVDHPLVIKGTISESRVDPSNVPER